MLRSLIRRDDPATWLKDKSSRPARFLWKWIIRLICLAGWMAAALSLIGFAGAVSHVADLASHFRLPYVLGMAPSLAVHLCGPRRWKLASLLLTVVFILNIALIVVLYLPSGSEFSAEPPGSSIRLLQFNTWFKNQENASVISLIEAEQPDVVSLQETSAALQLLVNLHLARRYEVLSAGSELLLIRRDAGSIQLLGWFRHNVDAGAEAIVANVRLDGQPVAILGFHAAAPIGFVEAATRNAQFEGIARWCRSQLGGVIVLGDLNASQWSYPFGRLLRQGGLIDSTRGFGFQPTWKIRQGTIRNWLGRPFRIPIDHCLHSPGLRTEAKELGPSCGSNHRSLFITLRLWQKGN